MKKDVKAKLEELIRAMAESKNILINLALLGDLMNKPLLSNAQTASLFLRDVKTMYNWRKSNVLVSKNIHNKHFYLWSDILDYLDKM